MIFINTAFVSQPISNVYTSYHYKFKLTKININSVSCAYYETLWKDFINKEQNWTRNQRKL